MNTTLTTHPGRQHPPQQVERNDEHIVRRVGLVDRLALHLGVALIAWGRRPSVVASRERRANRVEQQLARLDREREYERTARLSLPVR